MPGETHWQPGHYLQQFHAGYASKADLDKAMADAGFDTWVDLYGAKTSFSNNPGTPDIMSWINENPVDEPIQIWGRNAYFWKVDPEGNQLAYIDRVERTLLPDIEAILLKAIRVLAEAPWLLMPGIPVVIVVLAFNFMGDGIRDAADPYVR